MAITRLYKCQCNDRLCAYCSGHCTHYADVLLYRIDMEDHRSLHFCESCGEDALDSGLFTQEGTYE
jgi:hypothetical protein